MLVVFVGILLCVLWCDKRPHNFPPGPIGLPLVGYYPFLGKLPFKTLMELGKKYGGIYSIKIGNANILVVNKWKSVKEVLINQSEVFAGRPVTYSFNEVRRRLGEFLIIIIG